VRAEDVKQAAEFAARRLDDFNGLMDSGWKFSEPDEAALKEKAEEGKLQWWHKNLRSQPAHSRAGLIAYWEDEDDGQRVMGIGFAAVSRESLKEMLADARRLAQRLGFARVMWLAPAKPWVQEALREADFVSLWEGSAYLYGKGQ